MIDGRDEVIQTKLQMRKLQIVFSQGRKCFKVTHEIVTQVADCSTPKRGQIRKRLYLGVGEEPANFQRDRATYSSFRSEEIVWPCRPINTDKGHFPEMNSRLLGLFPFRYRGEMMVEREKQSGGIAQKVSCLGHPS